MTIFLIILLNIEIITAVSHTGIPSTCSLSDSCEDSRARLLNDIRERRCLCDKECVTYGDCCRDSDYGPLTQNSSFHCHVFTQFGGVYLKDTCGEEWTDTDVGEKCEEQLPMEDPLLQIPLTNRDTGITYKNYYCALCNNALDNNLEMWSLQLDCMSLKTYNSTYGNITSNYLLENLKFDEYDMKWGIDIMAENGKFYFYGCDINPIMPPLLENKIRLCVEVKSECDFQWDDEEVRDLCHSYMSAIYHLDEGFKNVHCAMCNFIDLKELTCQPVEGRENIFRTFSANSFSVLFDIKNVADNVGQMCDQNEIYDVFFKRCRTLICEKSLVRQHGKCVEKLVLHRNKGENIYYNKSVDYNYDNESLSGIKVDCVKVELPPENYVVVDNKTVFVPAYNQYFEYPSYVIQEDKLLVCAQLLTIQKSKFTEEMGYITMVGLGISIFSLMLHIIAFCIVPDIRNFSGKNLMCLVTSLLLAYLFFIIGQFTFEHKFACKAIGITTYFFFLVSFFWMNILAFDVWRTLRMATAELRVSIGNQWKRFLLYFSYCWLIATAIVTSSVLIDNAETIPKEFRPHFGSYYCWFGKSTALLVFFAGPVAYVMITNIILFTLSSRMILRTTVSSTNKCDSAKRNYKLYLRLALIMGLTWISGLIAGYLDHEIMWYAFIILNTLQGMFIFVAFTCNKKVWNGIKLKWNTFKPLAASRTSSSNSSGFNFHIPTRTLSTRLSKQSSGSNSKEFTA
ncbi:uncharacterized protein [Centruroides vittatus]